MANYTCPKHPEINSQRPDTCSKCGTRLVQRDEGGAKPGKHPHESAR
jgi:Heavy metal binding domain